MAQLNGNKVLLRINNTLVTCTTSNSMSLSTEMKDATTKCSGDFEESIPGKKSWSMDVEGVWDSELGYNIEEIYALWLNSTKVMAYFGETAHGGIYWKGEAYLESVSIDAPQDDRVTFSGTLKGTGELSAIQNIT